MGAYTSRPATLVVDFWRDEWRKRYVNFINVLSKYLEVIKDETLPPLLKACLTNELAKAKYLLTENDLSYKTPVSGLTPLHVCAITGSYECAQYFIQKFSGDVPLLTRNGVSALHLACFYDQEPIVQLLIPFLKGTISPENGITALHLCCWIGNIKLVKLLLKSGVHVDLSDSQGFTPLHIACHRGFDPIVKLLLSCGACPSAVSANLDTPLHLSCYEHHHIVCALLLSLNGFFFEKKSPTAVCEISQRKSTESIIINRRSDSHVNALPEAKSHPVSVLLDDFNSNQKDQKNILSPEDDTNKFLATLVKRSGSFSTGSARRKSQNEEAFIDFPLWEIKKAPQGAPSPVDVNAQDKELNTPLHFCSRKGFKTIAAWLLAAGADPSVVNVYGDTPLHSACYGRQFELVYMLLLSSSGEINMSRFNIFSESPLHAACTSGASDRIVRLLISRPSLNVNIQGPDGHTALHSACWNGHVNTTLLLLEHGADISKTTFDGSSPMKWAYTKGHDDIVELLQTYSGDRELFPIPSPLGKVRAITQGKVEIVKLRNFLNKDLKVDGKGITFLEAIGNGSFGKVYKAEFLGKIVAVKRLYSHSIRGRSDVDMFVKEVSILCSLNHVNIIKFFGACTTDPTQFCILTEYCANGSLHDTLHVEHVFFGMPKKLSIILGVAKGMKYLHTLPVPIIHRDLNSFNILLKRNYEPVIADFGEARYLDTNNGGTSFKELTRQPGNLRWMAPEVFAQSSKYTLKADVFSFALCVWELLALQVPFRQLQPAAAGAAMAYHHHRPAIPKSCPAYLSVLLRQAWESSIDKRPNFSEVCAWLEAHMNEKEIHDADISLGIIMLKERLKNEKIMNAVPYGMEIDKRGYVCGLSRN